MRYTVSVVGVHLGDESAQLKRRDFAFDETSQVFARNLADDRIAVRRAQLEPVAFAGNAFQCCEDIAAAIEEIISKRVRIVGGKFSGGPRVHWRIGEVVNRKFTFNHEAFELVVVTHGKLRAYNGRFLRHRRCDAIQV